MRFKKLKRPFVELLVHGNAVESLGINAELRCILLQRRRTGGEKSKMRGAGNEVDGRHDETGIGQCLGQIMMAKDQANLSPI